MVTCLATIDQLLHQHDERVARNVEAALQQLVAVHQVGAQEGAIGGIDPRVAFLVVWVGRGVEC